LLDLKVADSGEILMADERIDSLPPYRRALILVFQNYALFPHLTVEQNVCLRHAGRKSAEPEIATRAEQALAKVRCRLTRARNHPKSQAGQQRSGGVSAALVNRPRLLLLDEPLLHSTPFTPPDAG